jgi:O-antigen ligase
MNRLAYLLLWLFVFAIPWENAVTFPGVGTISRLLGIGAVGIGILAVASRGKFKLPGLAPFLLVAFVGYTCFSLFWTEDSELTHIRVWTYLQLLVMAGLIWQLAEDEWKQLGLLQAYVFGCYITAFNTIFNYLTGTNFSTVERYSANGFDPNDVGLALALAIPVAWHLGIVHRRHWSTWVYKLFVPICLFAILLTASRGAFVATILAMLIIPASFSKLSFSHKLSLMTLITLIFLSAPLLVPASSWERLNTIPEEMQKGDLSHRRNIWEASYETFQKHPLLGVGAGAHATAVRVKWSNQEKNKVAHNTYLSLLTEEGLIGAALFAALMISLLSGILSLPPLEKKLWIILMLTWGVGAASLTWEYRKPTWLFISLLATQTATARYRRKRSSPEYLFLPEDRSLVATP